MNEINYIPVYVIVSLALTAMLLYKIWTCKSCEEPEPDEECCGQICGGCDETTNPGWRLVDPLKKGGSYSVYFEDKHIANIRGKTKAQVLFAALEGEDMTDELEMNRKK